MNSFDKWFLSSDSNGLENYHQFMTKTVKIVETHYQSLEKPYEHIGTEDIQKNIEKYVKFEYEGKSSDAVLTSLQHLVMDHSLHISHPAAMAHLHCPPMIPALAAEVIISALNQSMDSWDQSPVATYIEDGIIQEMIKEINYPQSASGVFTSGGTQSNYMALLLARNEYCAKNFSINVSKQGLPMEAKKLRIFCSEKAHFTVQQSAAQLGLGMDSVISIKTNERYEMCTDALYEEIAKVKQQGNLPFAVVATIGTTDFGSIDPLGEICKLTDRENIWLHADAAYGGALLFSNQHSHLLSHLKKADSITMDFHKWFYQPVSCGAFFVKNSSMFEHIQLHADYLNPEEDTHFHLVDRSIQTTKRFDALKVWLTFQAVGKQEFGEMIDYTIKTAKQTANYLQKRTDIEALNNPVMNAIVFRYQPKVIYMDDQKQRLYENDINQYIQQLLYEQGQLIMAKTKFEGKSYLKLTMLNPLITFDETVKRLDEVINLGKELEKKEERLRERSVIG
ncbi:L-2,4-diaminobutyrate decarboxylase [Psychrobacillus insolitus]|uniref:L-2,4-diaminobutyrate decarboxylase n=1 Tax=Psychrobacillus insolitus TaxID=1461 RepID=A0A2W7P992_9BACI|nr:aspartate aminotransferase family protein [Psychrobacillus insolitus]PZX02871.1 L-2,4-diaminobutyrate decarboxylase [Psychrobacillus insolitus]